MHANPLRTSASVLLALTLSACGDGTPISQGTPVPPIPAANAGEPVTARVPLDADRAVAAGTLSWRIQLDGRIEKRPSNAGSLARHVAVVHRVVEGRARMRGTPVVGDLASANPGMHADAAMVASPGDRNAARDRRATTGQVIGMPGRSATWIASGGCTARVLVEDNDDTTRWVATTSEGRDDSHWQTTRTAWHADGKVDCRTDMRIIGADATRLWLDTQARRADLELATLEVSAEVTVDGAAVGPRRVRIPRLALANQPAAAQGRPFEGHAVLPVIDGADPPLTARVQWRFVPDAP